MWADKSQISVSANAVKTAQKLLDAQPATSHAELALMTTTSFLGFVRLSLVYVNKSLQGSPQTLPWRNYPMFVSQLLELDPLF